jgi:hypothetical protein
MALGAQRSHVISRVLRGIAAVTAIGIAAGTVSAREDRNRNGRRLMVNAKKRVSAPQMKRDLKFASRSVARLQSSVSASSAGKTHSKYITANASAFVQTALSKLPRRQPIAATERLSRRVTPDKVKAFMGNNRRTRD